MARFQRGSGVLLHPTALPGPHGIGSLGAQALAFIDWLQSAGQSYWQICPLVPTGYGDSPYQGFSAFAGNPNLINLDHLISLGLLSEADTTSLQNLPSNYVDFGALIPQKMAVLHLAWTRFSQEGCASDLAQPFSLFKENQKSWLPDYTLFMVAKERHEGRPWDEWEESLRLRKPEALEKLASETQNQREFHAFIQFLFDSQWRTVKSYANERGIRIIGDLPIFIAYDSADCWAHPHLFQLDAQGCPTAVAGVPPDYFSETGQLWGNPLYNWDTMEKSGFQWWISVLRSKLEQYDVLRIDHFRGFSAYWSVPYGEETAINGAWIPSPGAQLFTRVKEELGELPIIAEDLGVITQDVVELIEGCGFPGMKVMQFAFDSSEENDYLPHNYPRHCLVYTGTHDNDTAVGWYEKAPEADKATARDYLGLPEDATAVQAAQAMVRASLSSVADLAITPIQDLLALGSEARFNTPGTLGGNWNWRVEELAFSSEKSQELHRLTSLYGRLSQ